MKIVEDVRTASAPCGEVVLTLGSFDGVHAGHQAIVEKVVAHAKASGRKAAILTLRPHPRVFFRPDDPPHLLTSDSKKAELLAALGIEVLFYLPFDSVTAGLERGEFLRDILLSRCGARHFVIGYDLRFGKGALGDLPYMESQSEALGYGIERVDPIYVDGARVSSTRIRELVAAGDMPGAARLLGRTYGLQGQVMSGRGIGRVLGYPTANIRPSHTALPADGIYVAEAIVGAGRYHAAVNVGFAPTLAHTERTVEAFLLGFSGDLGGQEIEVLFHERLRGEAKFDSVETLTEAIRRDVAAVEAYFAQS